MDVHVLGVHTIVVHHSTASWSKSSNAVSLVHIEVSLRDTPEEIVGVCAGIFRDLGWLVPSLVMGLVIYFLS